MSDSHHLVVIAGPTGIGKTGLAINLALYYNTEIISADSRQFYKELKIGTAKPDKSQLEKVTHHFIDSLSIHQDYSAGEFESDSNRLLEKLFRDHEVVIVAGGSGFYIRALCEGIDPLPAIPKQIREELVKKFEQYGLHYLQDHLKEKDPEYYKLVDQQNPQRLIRALEVCIHTGKRYSSFLDRSKAKRPYHIHKIGLSIDREELYEGIEKRMDRMIHDGLFNEAEMFFPFRHLNALQTVGYTEIFDYLSGEYDREEAVRLLKRNSRRYAKRQLTWFRRDKEMTWFEPGKRNEIIEFLNNKLV